VSLGSAVLDPNVLVDALILDIDQLRLLQDEFGIRAWRVFSVTRTWPTCEIGDGEPTDLEEEIVPRPKVEPFDVRNVLRPCGLDEAGMVKLSEVSLANTWEDLTGAAPGATLSPGVERIYILREGYGQLQPDRSFVIDRPPEPDRVKGLGWTIWLRRIR
jgi:hypothetical protein